MWMHIDSSNYAAARAGVAISPKPTGPFYYLGSFRPNAGIWPRNATEADKQPARGNALARDFNDSSFSHQRRILSAMRISAPRQRRNHKR